ncbi:MAG: hypothetical protein ACJ72I_03240 [Pseudonocardiaceae bacterium]|jgi:hypothetical protein
MAIVEHRTRDGLADYGFSLEFQPGVGWRVYIMFVPFREHENSMGLPYQALDNDGRRYVEWGPKLENLGDAKTIASLWAELTERYQRSRERRAIQLDLIQRCLSARGQKQIILADPDRPDNTIGSRRATVKEKSDCEETKWSGIGTDEVA